MQIQLQITYQNIIQSYGPKFMHHHVWSFLGIIGHSRSVRGYVGACKVPAVYLEGLNIVRCVGNPRTAVHSGSLLLVSMT